MSDAEIARIGRALGTALMRQAYERDVDSMRIVAALKTELCRAIRTEYQESSAERTTPPDGGAAGRE